MFKSIGTVKEIIMLLGGWLLVAFGMFLILLVNLYPDPSPIFVHIIATVCLVFGLGLSWSLTKEHFLSPFEKRMEASVFFQHKVQALSHQVPKFFTATDRFFFPIAGAFSLLFFVGYLNDSVGRAYGLLAGFIYIVAVLVGFASAIARSIWIVFTVLFLALTMTDDAFVVFHLPTYVIETIVAPAADQLSMALPLLAAYLFVLGFVFYQMATFFSDRHIHEEFSERSLDTEIITRRTITLRDFDMYKSVWKYLIGITIFIALSYFLVEYFFWFTAGSLIIVFEFYLAQIIGYQAKPSMYINEHRGLSLTVIAGLCLFIYLITDSYKQPDAPMKDKHEIIVSPPASSSSHSPTRNDSAIEKPPLSSSKAGNLATPLEAPVVDTIPIFNAGFEEDILPAQGWQFGIKHWTGNGHGALLPPPIMYPRGNTPEGNQMAFLAKPSSWMANSTNVRWMPGYKYTLTVMIGRRLENTFGPGKYSLQLSSGDMLLVEKSENLPEAGTFFEDSLSVISPESFSKQEVDQPIIIKITNIDATQVNIDNVRLTVDNLSAENNKPNQSVTPVVVSTPRNETAISPVSETPSPVPLPDEPKMPAAANLTTTPSTTENPATPTPAELLPFILPRYGHLTVVPVDASAPITADIKALWAKGFYIHLKPDGNFGFNTGVPGPYLYLPVNRWKNENGVFTLILDKIVYAFTLPKKESAGETTLNTVDSTLNAFEMTYVTKEKGAR